jgi:peroxiredoxin
MRKTLAALVSLAVIGCGQAPQSEAPNIVGQAAPLFEAADITGKVVSLAALKGKTVVLEWNNPGCPSVQKHYGSGNMQKTQAEATKDGAVWLTVNSGAPGKQGHMNAAEAKAYIAEAKGQPSAYLLDPDGKIGKAFGAKTTPQLYIVNAAGQLAYAGAIDDRPTTSTDDVEGARNHVLTALAELKAGKPVSVPTSRPYGCSVKYADS